MGNPYRVYSRPYVGTKADGTKEVFRVVPSVITCFLDMHPDLYVSYEGPFKTLAGANFWAAWTTTPLTVTQAERGAKNAEAAALETLEALAA